MSATHGFCREVLALVMDEVRVKYSKEQVKKAWAWKDGCGYFEFHGPDGEFFGSLNADCAYGAKAEGWSKLLASKEMGR